MSGELVHGVIPLDRAALCLDDETIFHVEDAACPRCASPTFVLLAPWLSARARELASA